MSATDDAGWVRAGDMLQVRRVELDPRYRNLALFCRERGIEYRTAWDIENHARTNFRRGTLTSIEIAYGLQPGSIKRVRGGGEPVRVAQAAPSREERLTPGDAYEAAVLASRLPAVEKSEAVHAHRERMARELAELGVTEVPPFIKAGVRRLAAEQDGGEDGSASRQAGRPA